MAPEPRPHTRWPAPRSIRPPVARARYDPPLMPPPFALLFARSPASRAPLAPNLLPGAPSPAFAGTSGQRIPASVFSSIHRLDADDPALMVGVPDRNWIGRIVDPGLAVEP